MTPFWTPERIDAAKQILGQFSRVIDALPAISRELGADVTGDSLQKGFARAGITATTFLRKPAEAPNTEPVERAGPSMLWSQAMLDEAAAILRGHTSLAEAKIDIGEAVGFPVTIDSLRVAFTRNGMGLPSAYLQPAAVGTKKLRDMTPLESAEYARDVKAARADFRHRGRTEAVIEGIKGALGALKPITVNVSPRLAPTRVRYGREICWFDVSDVHVGHVVHPGTVGGINRHEHRDFIAKVDLWVESACAIIDERQRETTIDGVVIATLGDFVDGSEIFRGQSWEQDGTILEQLVDGSQAYGAALVKLASTFPHLQFSGHCIAGNHGRTATPANAPFRSSFDLIAYAMIAAHIKGSGVSNFAFKSSEAFFSLVETFGLVHLLVHGDWIRSIGGSPVGGMKAAKLKYAALFQSPIAFCHAGHFHSEQVSSGSGGDVMVNGSWIGTSEYSAKTLLEGQRPCQMAYGFTEEGLLWSRKIYLQSRHDMKPAQVHRVGA